MSDDRIVGVIQMSHRYLLLSSPGPRSMCSGHWIGTIMTIIIIINIILIFLYCICLFCQRCNSRFVNILFTYQICGPNATHKLKGSVRCNTPTNPTGPCIWSQGLPWQWPTYLVLFAKAITQDEAKRLSQSHLSLML